MIWKVEAQGDTVYVEADDIDRAEKKFEHCFGVIPEKLVKWTFLGEYLPSGVTREDLIADLDLD